MDSTYTAGSTSPRSLVFRRSWDITCVVLATTWLVYTLAKIGAAGVCWRLWRTRTTNVGDVVVLA